MLGNCLHVIHSLHRSSGAEFMMSGGRSKNWLVGHTLVTVTTSGLGGSGAEVCRRCAAIRRTGGSLHQIGASVLNSSASPAEGPRESEHLVCSCWCRGWAEIKIRRPTGNVSWLMRLQNRLTPFPVGGPSDDLSLLAANYPLEAAGEGERVLEEERLVVPAGEGERVLEEERPVAAAGEWTLEDSPPEAKLVEGTKEPSVAVEVTEPLEGDELSGNGDDGIPGVPDSSGIDLDGSGESEEDEESGQTPHASCHTSPSRRLPTSQSWSEQQQEDGPSLSPHSSSYSALVYLPPLLSYDEGDGFGRSPSFHGSGELLSEQEQVRTSTVL